MSGHVFKNQDGQGVTQRINHTDVKTTLLWLEHMINLDLVSQAPAGSYFAPSLGELRVDIDQNKLSPEQLVAEISNWCRSHKLDPKQYIKKSDDKVYFKTPINGNPAHGYVQTDFNFVDSEEVKCESDINFLARLRDRIVNQGMTPLIESTEPEIQGGRGKGIEHIEDLVFSKGATGIKNALTHIEHLKSNTAGSVTVKWDGAPAVIFGRNKDGEFVLTDKSGFLASGYNGLFTSPGQLTQQMAVRDKEAAAKGKAATRVATLAPLYQQLWPLLEQALPEDFTGFIQGDLLYTSTPSEQSGAYVFQPNTIEYAIPVNSKLGQEIGESQVGIAIHTYYRTPEASKEPLGKVQLNPVPGLLLIEPINPQENVQPTDTSLIKQLKSLVSSQGAAINTLFNPAELRGMQISDLPRLCIAYVNSVVRSNEAADFNPATLLPGFGKWLQSKVTPRKYSNIIEYLQSPRSNEDAMAAAFTAFVLLHNIKMDLLQQLDRQHPGQEGWVIATPGGITKFVNRFGFSRSNFANPKWDQSGE